MARTLALTVALMMLIPAESAAGANLIPRVTPQRDHRFVGADVRGERLILKFSEGTRIRLKGEALTAAASERTVGDLDALARQSLNDAVISRDLALVASVLDTAEFSAIRPLFDAPAAELERLRDAGQNASGHELADLALFFEVSLSVPTERRALDAVLDALNDLPTVELAYLDPPSTPPALGALPSLTEALLGFPTNDIAPPTPLWTTSQIYLNPAPQGIGATPAWNLAGGDGTAATLVDVEYGWTLGHEDVPGAFVSAGSFDTNFADHGTAVLGVLVGANNTYGITGIAHAARVGVQSATGISNASAIQKAAAAAGPGGIVLIELQTVGPDNNSFCPVEYTQATFDAIKTVTANGVVVVEASGNGASDLDGAAYRGVFDRTRRDSWAILVASSNTALAPGPSTNYGSRIDVHGWGTAVVTAGYGDLFNPNDPNQLYTRAFSGTSSASAIVAGAVASVQGARLAASLRPLLSWEMRTVLAKYGTPQATDAKSIGPLPDLERTIPAVTVCPSGSVACDMNCTTMQTDVNNCGSCGTRCPSTRCYDGYQWYDMPPLCRAGQCQRVACYE